jgi:hypothetical protein
MPEPLTVCVSLMHAGREPAANFRTAIFSRSNPDPKFFLERRRPSSAHAGSVSAPTVYSGARKEGNGDNSRRQQRPASASAVRWIRGISFLQEREPVSKKMILLVCWLDCLLMTRDCHAQATSSSLENQVHGATQRPASATVRRHDREEVGNWATRTSQPPTKRPASARPVCMRSLYERIGRSVCRGETDAFWRCALRARRYLLCESAPASGLGFELHTIQSTTSSTSVSTGTGNT